MRFQIIFNIVQDNGPTVTKQINLGDTEHPASNDDANALLLALAHDHNVVTPPPVIIFSY